jgi:hypothetical protein
VLGVPVVFKLRKKSDAPSPLSDGTVFVGEALLARPAVSAVLYDRFFEDGTPRKTATLLLFVDEGMLKACLRDRETEETAWVAGEGLEGLLDALEVGLQEGRLDWRREGKRKKR